MGRSVSPIETRFRGVGDGVVQTYRYRLPMIDPSRHVPLRSMPWSASEASAAIEEIVADAAAHFHAERFWPSHPREDGRPDGMANLY